MTDPTWLNMLLMLVETPGMMAPATTATKPAIRAYSMRSCPRRSRQARIRAVKVRLLVIFISPGCASILDYLARLNNQPSDNEDPGPNPIGSTMPRRVPYANVPFTDEI